MFLTMQTEGQHGELLELPSACLDDLALRHTSWLQINVLTSRVQSRSQSFNFVPLRDFRGEEVVVMRVCIVCKEIGCSHLRFLSGCSQNFSKWQWAAGDLMFTVFIQFYFISLATEVEVQLGDSELPLGFSGSHFHSNQQQQCMDHYQRIELHLLMLEMMEIRHFSLCCLLFGMPVSSFLFLLICSFFYF